jgi:hypothetical protein
MKQNQRKAIINIEDKIIPVSIVQVGMGIIITLSGLALVSANSAIDLLSAVRKVFAGQLDENSMLKLITKFI